MKKILRTLVFYFVGFMAVVLLLYTVALLGDKSESVSLVYAQAYTSVAEEETEVGTTVEETEESTEVETTTEAETTEYVPSIREQFVATAMSYVGTAYVFGGEDPATGIDCSKFVQLVCRQYGIELPRNSAVQYESIACHIGVNELLPGDLVFYNSQRTGEHYIGHVAIYIGNGMIVHARSEEYGVCTNPLDFNGTSKILGCARVL